MKRLNIIQSLFLLSLLVSITSFANTRTYVGTYPLSAIGLHHDTSKDGIAEYEYIDNFDKGRIYNGKFSIKWLEKHYNLSGNFINNLAQGQWILTSKEALKSKRENVDISMAFTYNNGILNGPCKMTVTSSSDKWDVAINFKKGIIDGDISIIRYNDKNEKEGSLTGKISRNLPIAIWDYTPFKRETPKRLRFTESDSATYRQLEIREIDPRTGDIKITTELIPKNYSMTLTEITNQLIPDVIDPEFREQIKIALRMIAPIKLRDSARPNYRFKLTEHIGILGDSNDPLASSYYPDETYRTAECPIDNNHIFDSCEENPEFPDGYYGLLKYINNHLRYPAVAQENGIQDKVTVQFVVTKNGSVGKVNVLRSIDPELDKEAVRVVRSLPNFTPGKMNGHRVNVWYTLPITFRLQD